MILFLAHFSIRSCRKHTLVSRILITFCWLCLSLSPLLAQLQGKVTDDAGNALPFATVHLKGTTRGVSANVNGQYVLELEPGSYDVVFQYIGYSSKTVPVQIQKQPQVLNVTLDEAGIELAAIEVLSGSEDPAYPIIREAIRLRAEHCERIKGYQCRAYIKGGFRLVAMPDTFLGQDVREGIGEDSTGFLYLSESVADISFRQPNDRKEVMIASKVSGDANGFSFNRFGILDFCTNTLSVGRPLINPIADNALSYYRYRLLQTYYDEEGREIHKIEVTPRRSEDPVFKGVVYIIGELFRYHSLELLATSGNMKMDFLDSFLVQQSFLPIEGDYWPLFQQTLRFRFSILGFGFGGNFTSVTSNYVINPEFPQGFFNKEIMKVEKAANKQDSLFWDEKRPIPLTLDEATDYIQKDSIAEIHGSKVYQDSLDRVGNKFKWSNLAGYTYRRRHQGWSFQIGPQTDWFNAVQGWTLGGSTQFNQRWKDHPGRSLFLKGRYIYGFSDGGHRYQVTSRWEGNALDNRFLEASFGNGIRDLNPENTFPATYDAYLLLFHKSSVNRYYQSSYASLRAGSELGVGWQGTMSLGIDERNPVVNTTDYAFRKFDRKHPSNNDLGNEEWQQRLGANTQLLWQASLTWRPGTRYTSYPDQRILTGSKYPAWTLYYQGGFEVSGKREDFHLIRLRMNKMNQVNTIYGSWSYNAEIGHFLSSPSYYHDFRHFSGNSELIITEKEGANGFKTLPVYSHSTRTTFFQTQQEWDDNSFVFDKIPGVRKLGWSMLFGYNHLWTREMGHWSEASIGIGRIGYKIFRPFNVHSVFTFEDGRYQGFTLRLGIKSLPLSGLGMSF